MWGVNYTLRPKILRALPEFMDEFPPLHKQEVVRGEPSAPIDWQGILAGLGVDRAVPEVTGFKPGERAAWAVLKDFMAVNQNLT
jgi:deoxyribodipyrimidine photo-lyase